MKLVSPGTINTMSGLTDSFPIGGSTVIQFTAGLPHTLCSEPRYPEPFPEPDSAGLIFPCYFLQNS